MKQQLKIGLVSEYYFPANNAPAARFKPLVNNLSKHFKVEVYTSKISADYRDDLIVCNAVPFPENTHSIVRRLGLELLFSLETFFRLLFSNCDLYYITSPSFFNCLAAYCYCRLLNKPYILDVRDDYPRVFFETNLVREDSLLGRVLKAIEKRLYKNSFLLVAATEGLATNIRKIYPREVYLLRNGFSEAIFQHNPDKYPTFTMVLHGNLSAFQGIDTIIALGEELERRRADIEILIIGKGSEDHKLRDCQSKRIRYLGPKPHHEIPTIIERAHVGLSFRKGGKISEDSFPVRAYEYIGACLPIMVTPISEAGTFIEKANIGLQFDETDIERIALSAIHLMEDTSVYQLMVDNLKETRLVFSREKINAQFVDFLLAKLKR